MTISENFPEYRINGLNEKVFQKKHVGRFSMLEGHQKFRFFNCKIIRNRENFSKICACMLNILGKNFAENLYQSDGLLLTFPYGQ